MIFRFSQIGGLSSAGGISLRTGRRLAEAPELRVVRDLRRIDLFTQARRTTDANGPLALQSKRRQEILVTMPLEASPCSLLPKE
jgi:hypothetical protein